MKRFLESYIGYRLLNLNKQEDSHYREYKSMVAIARGGNQSARRFLKRGWGRPGPPG